MHHGPHARIKTTRRWHWCKGVIRAICEIWVVPKLCPYVPFASKSGGSCPPAPMGAPPMNSILYTSYYLFKCTIWSMIQGSTLFSVCHISVVEQTSSYSSCSTSFWCVITQLFSIIWTGCWLWHFSWRFPFSPLNFPFLKVISSIAIYLLTRLIIFWNLTTRCLAVTDGSNVG